jgi:uncharacterized protein (TIGR00730 family)
MKSVCVYCGSSPGAKRDYAEGATALGRALARNGQRLVYGGGNVGLMGIVADATLATGGEVIGVIPQALVDRELAHQGLSRLHIVASMHERKAMMAELADGFIALPGGLGTLEELFEIWTWAQLGMHRKPIGLLNVHGFFDPLIEFIGRLVTERFVRRENREMLFISAAPAELLKQMESYQPPSVAKWISPRET